MSRSKKGSKGPGYEFWSKRPGNWHGGYGPDAKRETHRAERREARQQERGALDGQAEPKESSMGGDI